MKAIGLLTVSLLVLSSSFSQDLETIRATYQKTEKVDDHLYAVQKADLFALYDESQNKFLTGFEFIWINPFFSNGVAYVGLNNGKSKLQHGLIGRDGQVIVQSASYDHFEELKISNARRYNSFSYLPEDDAKDMLDAVSYIIFSEQQKTGLMDSNGRVLIPALYDDIWNINFGLAAVIDPDGKIGIYIAKTGEILVPVTMSENEFLFVVDEKLIYRLDSRTAGFESDTLFYRNGMIRELRTMKAGYQNGPTLFFDQFGQFEKEIIFEHGDAVKSTLSDRPEIVLPHSGLNARDFELSNDGSQLITLPAPGHRYYYLFNTRNWQLVRKIPVTNDGLYDYSRGNMQMNDTALFVSISPNKYITMNLFTGIVTPHEIGFLPFYEDGTLLTQKEYLFSRDWLSVYTAYESGDKVFLDIYCKQVYTGEAQQYTGIEISDEQLIEEINQESGSFKWFPERKILVFNNHYDLLLVYTLKGKKLKSVYKKKLFNDEDPDAKYYSAMILDQGILISEEDPTQETKDFLFLNFETLTEYRFTKDMIQQLYPLHFANVTSDPAGRVFFLDLSEHFAQLLLVDLTQGTVNSLSNTDNGALFIYSFLYDHLIQLSSNGTFAVGSFTNQANKTVSRNIENSSLQYVSSGDDGFLAFNTTSADSSRSVINRYYLDLASGYFEKSRFKPLSGEFQMYVNDSLFYTELVFQGLKDVYLIGKHDNKCIYNYSADGRYHQLGFYNRHKTNYLQRHVFLHLFNEQDYLLYTPDGYYMASKGIGSVIYFEKDLELFPFEQFDLKYNRPDIILDRLGYADSTTISAYHAAYQKRLKKMGFTEEMLKDDVDLPEIDIENFEQIPTITDSASIELNLNIRDKNYPLDRIRVWVNDVAVYGTGGISLRHLDTKQYKTSVSVALAKGSNKIQVSVLNQAGVESFRETFEIECLHGKDKPDLYLLAIGESEFQQSAYNLVYASKDAQDIVDLFAQSKAYGHINSKTLLNEEVTKSNVIALSTFLDNADINDHVVIFFAGHGVLDTDLNYYLATYDMDFHHPSKAGLSYEDLEYLLDGIKPLRKTLIIDACHSGEIDKEETGLVNIEKQDETEISFRAVGSTTLQQLSLRNTSGLTQSLFADLRKGTGATVISSAGGMEFAIEGDTWKNGLFTYCLIKGIKTMEADSDQNGEIWLSEIRSYVSNQVFDLSKGMQLPSSRMENLSMDFRIW